MISLRSKSTRKGKKQDQEDQDLIAASLKRFKITYDAESDARSKSLKDLTFSIGEGQWDAGIKADRDIEGRPCLTVNRIPTFLRQYTGQERQSRPAMLVSPVGSGTDTETAEIIQGVLRHIEQVSFADFSYDFAYDLMLRIGWGNWRVNTAYLNDKSFDQEPRIEPIENPFAVYMSPIRKPDGTDPLWCHVVEDMSKDEFKACYPDSKMVAVDFASDLGNQTPTWVTDNGVRIAEYWWIELGRKRLYLLDNGSTWYEDELIDEARDRIVSEREVVTRTVNCVKHNAIEVLERYEWRGKYIPILEVSGIRLNINGRLYRAGMVRDVIDPQRLYNFMITGQAEMIALAPKDPALVPEGSLGNHEEEWRQANRVNYPFLYYKAYNEQGQQLPPPTRAGRTPPIEAMAEMVKQSDYDLKAVTGIYGPGLGEQGPPGESGFAILTRQQQSDTGSVNWSDNLNRTIRWQGNILLDLFPKLINAPRVSRIIKPDDEVGHAVLANSQNGPGAASPEANELLDGEALKKVYDVGVGEYDVVLSSGPTYRTARQEAFRSLTAIVTAKPDLFPLVGDIWAKYADWPGAHVLADRLKKMLPPNLQDANDTDPAAQVSSLQAQLQALGAQHNQLVAELNRASDTIRTKRLDIESRERIALMNDQTQILIQELKSNAAAANAQLVSTLETIQHRMELLHESMTVNQDAGDESQNPELPSQVQPKTAVIAAAPVPRPEPIGGAQP